jgi:hypothetical protein
MLVRQCDNTCAAIVSEVAQILGNSQLRNRSIDENWEEQRC